MADTQYNFYECDNPDCGLRFPGYEGAPRWNRCPECRSNTHIVASVNNFPERTNGIEISRSWKVEALLDNLRSAWNVGSIFRTSDGIGIQKIYLCGISPTPENPKVSKTALGAETSIEWEHAKNGVKTAQNLKSRGYVVFALEDLPGAIPLFQVDISFTDKPLVLVVGNEVSGIDPGIIELCDRVISIPMRGKKRSYNVAIAYAIAVGFLAYKLGSSVSDLSLSEK